MSLQRLRTETLERDNFICQTCLRPFTEQELEMHHVIPKRLRGLDSLNNTTTACTLCHKLIELKWIRSLPSFSAESRGFEGTVWIRIYGETHRLIDRIGKRKEYQADIVKRVFEEYAARHKEELA